MYQTVQICWNSHFTVGASERVLLHVMSDTLHESLAVEPNKTVTEGGYDCFINKLR